MGVLELLMVCSFCNSPAAHPATGCQYGPSTLACRDCVESFWTWVRTHTNKRSRRGHGPETALSFYEAAALFSSITKDAKRLKSSSAHDDAASRHAPRRANVGPRDSEG